VVDEQIRLARAALSVTVRRGASIAGIAPAEGRCVEISTGPAQLLHSLHVAAEITVVSKRQRPSCDIRAVAKRQRKNFAERALSLINQPERSASVRERAMIKRIWGAYWIWSTALE